MIRAERPDRGRVSGRAVHRGPVQFLGNYLPRVYPVHLRGTGEGFAANIGGRMIGTSFAAVSSYSSPAISARRSRRRLHDGLHGRRRGAVRVFWSAAIACFCLPEPVPEELARLASGAAVLLRHAGMRPADSRLDAAARRASMVSSINLAVFVAPPDGVLQVDARADVVGDHGHALAELWGTRCTGCTSTWPCSSVSFEMIADRDTRQCSRGRCRARGHRDRWSAFSCRRRSRPGRAPPC